MKLLTVLGTILAFVPLAPSTVAASPPNIRVVSSNAHYSTEDMNTEARYKGKHRSSRPISRRCLGHMHPKNCPPAR